MADKPSKQLVAAKDLSPDAQQTNESPPFAAER
jgi:hypothetical protein